MVKDIIDAHINERIFIYLFLNHNVPETESLPFIGFFIEDSRITVQYVGPIVGTVYERIAVEHIDIVITPNAAAPAALFIFVRKTDIDFMHRFIQELPRHGRIALIHGMKIGIADFCRPVLAEFLPHFRFQSRNFRLADVFKAVNHIGSTLILLITAQVWRKIHQSSRIVHGHVVLNTVMENSQAGIGVFIFSFNTHIEVQRFFGTQVRITGPIPTELGITDADRIAGIHLPVVPKLAHARFRISRADIRLKTAMSIVFNIMRHADISGYIAAEQTAVVISQRRHDDSIFIYLPHIGDEYIFLVYLATADGDTLIAVAEFF